MDKKILTTIAPDYKRIYNDIIIMKYPYKKKKCEFILDKPQLTSLDIIKLNSLIFENTEMQVFNQRHKSYNLHVIKEILLYQRKNNLNNTQLASHFRLSRNTVAKWKRLYSYTIDS